MLGANICYLLRERYQIIALDTNKVEINQIISIVGSALDIAVVESILSEEHIDVLIHCAAITDMDRCEKESNYANIVNELLPKNLSYLCNRYQTKMVFISSDSVYCGTNPGLHTETDAVEPMSIYAKTKLAAESYILKQENSLVVRTNMFGFNYRDKKSFGEWVVQSLLNGETLSMFYDVTFSPLLVNDLVSLLELTLEKDLCGLYNVGSYGAISKYDLGMTIKEVFGLPGKITKASMREHAFVAPRTQNMGLDVNKIKRALMVEIPTPQQSVERFFELYRSGYSLLLKDGR